jgi:hypothetical protein
VVCRLGGTEPTNECGGEYTEVFAFDQLPLPKGQGLVRRVKIDLWTGYEASDACDGPTDEKLVMNVTDTWALKWFETGEGKAWLNDHGLDENPNIAPERECKEGDPQPKLEINLADGQVISSPLLEVKGTASADGGFKQWRLEFGLGEDPNSWVTLAESDKPVEGGTLTTWNVATLPNGIVTLRLTLIGEKTEMDKRIRLNLSLPIPTVPTSTPTLTPFPTDTPTFIVIPSDTPIPSETPSETPTP